MRPNSSGGSVSAMASPTCAAGLRRRASSRLIWLDVVLDLVDHQQVAREPQLAGLGVDLGVDVGLAAVARARRLGDRVLHGGDDDAAIDRLLARDRVGDLQQFEPVGADGHRSFSFVCSAARRRCRQRAALVRCRVGRRGRARPRRAARASALPRRSDCGDQLVGEDELGFRHVVDRQHDLGVCRRRPHRRGASRARTALSTPSRTPRKRLRPSSGTASSIFTTWPA